VTGVTDVSCSNRHASLGNWSAAPMGVEPLTSWATSRDANHYATHAMSGNFSDMLTSKSVDVRLQCDVTVWEVGAQTGGGMCIDYLHRVVSGGGVTR